MLWLPTLSDYYSNYQKSTMKKIVYIQLFKQYTILLSK